MASQLCVAEGASGTSLGVDAGGGGNGGISKKGYGGGDGENSRGELYHLAMPPIQLPLRSPCCRG